MSWVREEKLLDLISYLWNLVPEEIQAPTELFIREMDMSWAIPGTRTSRGFSIGVDPDPEEWLTIGEIAYHLGMTDNAVRNWRTRHDLEPIKEGYGKGRNRVADVYRWGDVDKIRRKIEGRGNTPTAA